MADFDSIERGAAFLDDLRLTEEAVAPLKASGVGNPIAVAEEPPEGDYYATVSLVRGDALKPEPVDWLWRGWLAAGKLHILAGAPGTGKTSIAVALAASITSGGCWPDGGRAGVGNVAIWSGEDDPADTLVPRLMASGADLSRVHFVGSVHSLDEGKRPFDPARDAEPLRRKLLELGDVRLLIVDPIVSAVIGDSHKNAEVRRGLQPLVDLAASTNCALLGITHFSKGTAGRDPGERVTGSLAFGALARVVMVAAKGKDESQTSRIFCRAKSNIGPDDGGFEYDLQQTELKACPGIFASYVAWAGAVTGSARELLAVADESGDGEGGSLSDAKRFLADLLSDGPMSVKAIKADADGAGYAWATIRRAKDVIGIEATRDGFGKGGTWTWKLSSIPSNINYPEKPEHHRCSTDAKNTIDAQKNQNLSTYGETRSTQGLEGGCSSIGAQVPECEHLCESSSPSAPIDAQQKNLSTYGEKNLCKPLVARGSPKVLNPRKNEHLWRGLSTYVIRSK